MTLHRIMAVKQIEKKSMFKIEKSIITDAPVLIFIRLQVPR